ncbi:hypothetical protein NMY22_g2552 [Coprinellus aureogranulatus]|nr:hypothetical protein NMY22_g2552 [Coprinellus aureogranulatus]
MSLQFASDSDNHDIRERDEDPLLQVYKNVVTKDMFSKNDTAAHLMKYKMCGSDDYYSGDDSGSTSDSSYERRTAKLALGTRSVAWMEDSDSASPGHGNTNILPLNKEHAMQKCDSDNEEIKTVMASIRARRVTKSILKTRKASRRHRTSRIHRIGASVWAAAHDEFMTTLRSLRRKKARLDILYTYLRKHRYVRRRIDDYIEDHKLYY